MLPSSVLLLLLLHHSCNTLGLNKCLSLVYLKKWYKWINNSASTMNWLIDLMEAKGYTTTMEIGYTDTEGVFTAHPGSHNWVE